VHVNICVLKIVLCSISVRLEKKRQFETFQALKKKLKMEQKQTNT